MYEGKQFNEKIRQIGFLLILVFWACLIVQELRYFVGAVLGGFTLFMMLRSPHRYLRKKGWSNGLTTAFLMVSTFVFLVLLLGGLITIFYDKIKSFGPHVVMDGIHHIHDVIIQRWNYDIFSTDLIQKALGSAGNFLPALLTATGNVVANTVMMLFVLFFLLQQRVQFERGMENFLPLSPPSIRILKRSVYSMVMTNAVGIPLIMFGQAILSGLAYWLLDAGDPVVWGLMTGFFGLIPVLGTAGIWIPLSIELLVGGHVWQGIVLVLYGTLVVSSVENGVRMVFMQKKANVHPLITLFGVILGMNLFGFWGIIFGPLVLSGFFLFIRIYSREFSVKPTDNAPDET